MFYVTKLECHRAVRQGTSCNLDRWVVARVVKIACVCRIYVRLVALVWDRNSEFSVQERRVVWFHG